MDSSGGLNTSPRRHMIESIKKTVFYTFASLVVLIAVKNTFSWHIQRFWGASGEFWQNTFDYLYQLFGANDFTVAVIGTFVLTNLVYWSLNAILIIVDLTGAPKFLLQYKIQPDKNVPLDVQRLKKALQVVLFNTTVIGIPSLALFWYLARLRGCSFSGSISTFQWFLFEFVVFILTEEVGFYYSHRLLHHRFFYKHIHKMHHEWTASIGIISLYAHPLEHFLSNYFPVSLGPLIMGSHIGVVWLWFCAALASTTNAHSGYHFPFFPSPEAHDFHHFKFTNNFGVLGILDRLHGTDDEFRRTKAYDRHWMMLSLTPPRSLVPDDDKKVTLQDE